MIEIHVGSKNKTKIQASENVLTSCELYKGVPVVGVEVGVEEFGHPKTLEETIAGAKQRAKLSFDGAVLGVGLESGLYEAPGTKTGYLETTVCALYDGKQYSIGLSPSFEWPQAVLQLILEGRDGSQAFREVGLTDHVKLGTAEGAIHTLTQGATNRTELNELAIVMALIQLQNPTHY